MGDMASKQGSNKQMFELMRNRDIRVVWKALVKVQRESRKKTKNSWRCYNFELSGFYCCSNCHYMCRVTKPSVK